MARVFAAFESLTGIGLIAWLLWKASCTYVLGGAVSVIAAVLLYIPLVIGQWLALRRVVPPDSRLRLCCLTSPSVFLSLFMVARLTAELSLASPGWSSKEMAYQAYKQGVPLAATQQFYEDTFARIRSEREMFMALSAALLLRYGKGCRSST